MNAVVLSRRLGWFSLALGATEVLFPAILRRQLGLGGGSLLVRVLGAQEIAAGLAVLAKPDHPFGVSARVAGDAMDIAVLASALGPRNARRGAAEFAFALVLGVTALDMLCASALAADSRRRVATARRSRVVRIDRLTNLEGYAA